MSLLRTGAINQGRHTGLQQLEAMAAATHAFLGPNKAYKFIQDEASAEAALVCSCYRLLEQLELSDSVGQLLYETTRAHQEALRSGTSTLVFLAGVWSRVALECLHKGISIPHIIAGMSKGLDLCVEACMRNAVTVEEVVCKGTLLKQPNSGDCMKAEDGLPTELSLTTGGQESTQNTIRTINGVFNLDSIKKTLPTKHRIKLKHSRHFNSSSNEAEGTQSAETLCQKSSKTFNVDQLAEAVSHGCEASMSLVVEASRIQSRHGKHEDQSQVLDVDRLVTCPLPGLSEEHSCVLHGYVLLLCVEQASLVKHLKERTLKIGLINGDLSETYRHVGFNRSKNITYVSDCSTLTGVSREEEWIDGALGKLLKLSIDVLLVTGVVTAQLKDHCLNHNILVIERVKANILKDFSTTTGAIPISYVTQLSERCVGAGVCVNVLREYRGEGKTENILLNVVASGTSLVTAVVASSVHAKLQSLVDQFWSCAYRLHHALKDGKLLPGGGAAELLCIHQLYKCIDMSQSTIASQGEAARATAPYETTILQLMADSWMDYISTLKVNAGQVVAKAQAWTCIAQHLKDFESRSSLKTEMLETLLKKYFYTKALRGERESEGDSMVEREREMVGVYDNVTVKLEAWRRALDLVFLILQTDMEIIVGINEQESQHRDVMFL
ncbi:Bardet-Biedl syndrome 12 protein [Colossoma macropomum]|uniref:Bardet-Biedl syndrome 12 protein n=1 Tax=Colossoma macropomum TaxID=42526 RepID=UPI001864CC25|nr:Bardet-Biedl syndrome 12 protein [Colossoma macropomum]